MRRTRWGREALRDVETLYAEGSLAGWPDGRLLEQFVRGRSERAFAALFDRHGPRVLWVCRAVTGDPHAAEDALQATFLVLARKAGTLRVDGSLGPWLHGVAVRIATTARTMDLRRRRREERAARPASAFDDDPVADPDLARLLHLEIDRLPAPYREAVLLCDVQGLSHEDAARILNRPVGTVKSRHSRARARLRDRLTRRGLAPAALAAAVVGGRASAAVPQLLRSETIRGALLISSGGSLGGTVPAAAYLLSEGMKTAMTTPLRTALGALLLGLTATAAVVTAQDEPRAPAPAAAAASAAPALPPVSPTPPLPSASVTAPPEPPTAGADPTATGPAPKPSATRPAPPTSAATVEDTFADTQVSGRPRAKTSTTVSIGPPSEEEIWKTLLETAFSPTRISVEKVAENVEAPKDVPKIGPCERIRVSYKCVVRYTFANQPYEDNLTIEKVFLRRVTDGKVVGVKGGDQLWTHTQKKLIDRASDGTTTLFPPGNVPLAGKPFLNPPTVRTASGAADREQIVTGPRELSADAGPPPRENIVAEPSLDEPPARTSTRRPLNPNDPSVAARRARTVPDQGSEPSDVEPRTGRPLAAPRVDTDLPAKVEEDAPGPPPRPKRFNYYGEPSVEPPHAAPPRRSASPDAGPRDRENRLAPDQEKRLRDMEQKLDRILKALEERGGGGFN